MSLFLITGIFLNGKHVWRPVTKIPGIAFHNDKLDDYMGTVYSVCVTPDGKHVVSGSGDNPIRITWIKDAGLVREIKTGPYTFRQQCLCYPWRQTCGVRFWRKYYYNLFFIINKGVQVIEQEFSPGEFENWKC